jgi:hypothetical protein
LYYGLILDFAVEMLDDVKLTSFLMRSYLIGRDYSKKISPIY